MSKDPPTRAHRVLLVDADFRSSQRLAALLAEDGFEVETARDGAAATTRLGRAPLFDALITELRVPLADGATIARFARSQNPLTRVVVLTSYPNAVVPAAFGGCPAVLDKPLDYARLLTALGLPPSESVSNRPPAARFVTGLSGASR